GQATRYQPALPELANVIKHELCAPHRKGRHDQGAAPLSSPVDNAGQGFLNIVLPMFPVSIRRFEDQVIRSGDSLRIWHQGVVIAPEVTGKHQPTFPEFKPVTVPAAPRKVSAGCIGLRLPYGNAFKVVPNGRITR